MDVLQFNRLLRNIGSDRRALEKIYQEYYPKLVLHLRYRFGNLLSPDDIAEDVFLALMRSPPQRKVDHPTAWLMGLADHKAIDLLRKYHKAIDLLRKYRKETDLPETLAMPPPFDNVILRSDVRQELKTLDKETQEIVYLHIWEGYSLKEISDLKNIGYETVRKKTSRAYRQLEKLFRKGEEP